MDRDEQIRHDEQRKKLWCETWIAVAGSANCVHKDVATDWADEALKQFDIKFPKPNTCPTTNPIPPAAVAVPTN